jgi:hypothetical protein
MRPPSQTWRFEALMCAVRQVLPMRDVRIRPDTSVQGDRGGRIPVGSSWWLGSRSEAKVIQQKNSIKFFTCQYWTRMARVECHQRLFRNPLNEMPQLQ